ncbi:FAD binding domain-containing protein [Pochonia chlamydosporia 170]|uniref:FAD binding domain-containing protein n=1 Tax=Pochonia chlamydosporia 170 TaxID=1380566 RepID=A0A179FBD4_METCM|nr:FAD binding domain-containing protein [Pochonia chlamydosporia 170]OAQ62766.1 FAD binding domain-containing protein [Pochonia chlamydosporia 170]
MKYLLSNIVLASTTAALISGTESFATRSPCDQIASNISGQLYYPSDPSDHFSNGTEHFLSSSTEMPMCVVEVTSIQDVSHVLKIVRATRTPFAVKSGGHATNPGFSSTTGVLMSLSQLTQVNLSEDKSTVEIGLGNRWTDVYNALDGSGVNAVGGRVPGPGTGGFTLGGGYSWLTNQFGLACDTVISFNLVLPNGTATVVDWRTPDLFFALKGGLNRFGVVTSIVYKTVPQPETVYGGFQVFHSSAVPVLTEAILNFKRTTTESKAQVILSITGGPDSRAVLLSFYDGPGRPTVFDPFNNISALNSTLKDQTFASFVSSIPTGGSGKRGAFATLSTSGYTQKFLTAVANETAYYGWLGQNYSGEFSYEIQPFMDYGKHATDSAYPHQNSPLPLNLGATWKYEADDTFWRGIMQQSIDYLTEVAKEEGIYNSEMYAYPNYALGTYTGVQLYGLTNTARLRDIQSQYDPSGVMLLAGGFSL